MLDPIDVKLQLRNSEFKQFKYSLKEWEQMAKAGGYNHEMNLEYYKSRITRLQALQVQVSYIMAKYTNSEQSEFKELLDGIYNDTYYRNIYTIQQAQGKFTADFAHIDKAKMEAILNSGWSGSNFSKRLWKDSVEKLPEILTSSLFRGIATGYSTERLVKLARVNLRNFSDYQIHRLVVTEAAYITEQAALDSYEQTGVEKVEWLATLESHICEVCAKLDGKIFEISKAERCPLHPYCRCTLALWYKELEDIKLTRWSRNPATEKGDFIDDISYGDWLSKVNENHAVTKARNSESDKRQYNNWKNTGVKLP